MHVRCKELVLIFFTPFLRRVSVLDLHMWLCQYKIDIKQTWLRVGSSVTDWPFPCVSAESSHVTDRAVGKIPLTAVM